MPDTARQVELTEHPDVNQIVKDVEADHTPRMLRRKGEAIAVIVSVEDYTTLLNTTGRDIWAGYDPDKLRKVYAETPPIFENFDTEEFMREMHEMREQDSSGRHD